MALVGCVYKAIDCVYFFKSLVILWVLVWNLESNHLIILQNAIGLLVGLVFWKMSCSQWILFYLSVPEKQMSFYFVFFYVLT